jgi:hypothetical protein
MIQFEPANAEGIKRYCKNMESVLLASLADGQPVALQMDPLSKPTPDGSGLVHTGIRFIAKAGSE